MITFKEFIYEQEKDLSQYVDLLNDVAMFITLNTSMIQQYATDIESKNQLREMQKNLKNPILNGMSFVEVHSKPNIYRNKNVIPIILKYIENLIKYVEPRIQRFIKPESVSIFQNKLDKIRKQLNIQNSYLLRPY